MSIRIPLIFRYFAFIFLINGCEEKITISAKNLEEELGDGLLDKIEVNFEDDYYRVEYNYTWDDFGRLSSIGYSNPWIDDGGFVGITYLNENKMIVSYQFGGNDSWGTDTIYFHSGMVDSIFFCGGTHVGEPYKGTRYFDHQADSILQFTTTNWLYTETVTTDTAIWYVEENGLLTSYQSSVIEEFTYDNMQNPLASSFVQFSPMYSGNWIMPILISSNRTLRRITDRNIETTASYEYLSNDFPAESFIDSWICEYSY